jgi:hypothetical protein
MKRTREIKTISAKKSTRYEIRKEHVTYFDGTTEDRLVAYTFEGKLIGSLPEAERYFNNLQRRESVALPKKVVRK